MDYEDKIFKWLNEDLKPGTKVQIKTLTNQPEKFTKAVKFLMDCRYIKDISFTSDYSCIYKSEF